MSIRVLLVEDDRDFRESLESFLSDAGLEVCAVGDAAGLAREMTKAPPDVVVLDLNLPGTDGLSAALTMRETSNVGIVVLTGRTEKQDRFQGLAIGVDHYLTKPTDPAELELVIRNLHRRLSGAGSTPAEAREAAPWVFHAKQWVLESPAGIPVKLTGTELQILEPLVSRPGAPVSRTELMRHAGRQDPDETGRGLDLIIFRLRRKVEKACGFALPVVSARGKGYVFAGEVIFRPE
ncbi:response regulator transcription factor [Azorhizobium sp. AG788]|uniref:response regulator transcription factor n=1 Tax=Azorhizobium sp. AG788 TaxID=2183897 RepID=UPI003138E7E2